jgi:hypothetical protein
LKKLFLLFAAFALVLGLSACKPGEIECEEGFEPNAAGDECVEIEPDNTAPTISGVTDITLFVGGSFDQLAGITATDAEDGTITSDITVSGTVDLTTAGTYTLTYTVTDSAGELTSVTRTVTVDEVAVVYPTGWFNYKFATTELRHTFMAAAEKYLMNNMHAGVPLFANGSFALYSSRLQLPVDEYVAVMGYGTRFATMSADDTNVQMEDGSAGNAGEYTYRTHSSTNPQTFNQWIYDTSTDSTFMAEYYGALYDYVFNADKTGYEVIPVMAAADPAAVDGTSRTTDTGKFVATSWDIEIRDGLTWTYFGGTRPSYLAAADDAITADDFVDTYKIALDEEWFRAISGGGDFLGDSQKIVNAQEYVDGSADWEDVGIEVVDGDTIRFTFVNEMSEWNVKYWLSSFVMAPIHTEMYDELGDTYGTSPSTIAYHGPYAITAYEEDVILRMVKNDNYALPELDFYTHKTYKIIEDTEVAFQTFVDGQLESIGLPTAKYEEYKNHPGLKQIPGATTFRIMINGLQTPTAQAEQFPGSTWTPEPLLGYEDFKMAMFFSIDRQYLAETVLKTSTTNMYLFSDAYMVDPEKGVPYRATAQGETVGVGLSPTTNGYNFDAAVALFENAVEDAIADGYYTAGTEASPTTIVIEFNYFSGSDAQVTMFEYVEDAFEAAFEASADSNWVGVDLQGFAKDFPDIYYDYMMIGEFDLSIGGISGSTLDAASFLDTYSSDNRSGFTLNWGIDTTQAEIPVQFTDFEGVYHNEMWSFDAIYSALNGRIYLVNGEEAVVPSATDIVKEPSMITFTLDQADNADYENITFSLQYYDLAAGYLDVTGWSEVDVSTLTDADTTTDGFQIEIDSNVVPFYYGYDSNGDVVYQGDYQIVVYFEYASDGTESSTTSAWWENPPVFEAYASDAVEDEVAGTTALLNLELFGDLDAADVTSIKVFEEQLNPFTELDPTDTIMVDVTADVTAPVAADATDGDVDYVTLTLAGLEFDTFYVIELVVDGSTLWTYFSTGTEATVSVFQVENNNDTPSDDTDDFMEDVLNDNSLDILVTLDAVTDITAVTSVDAWYVDPVTELWASMAATIAVSTNTSTGNLVYTVSGLAPAMDYTLEVTLDDGTVLFLDITTLDTPVTITTVDDMGTTVDTDDVDTVADDSFTAYVTLAASTVDTIDQVDLWNYNAAGDLVVLDGDVTATSAGVYDFTGLMQDTDYVVSVTTTNGGFYLLEVTTLATDAELALVVNNNATTTTEDDDYEELFDTGFNFEVTIDADSNGEVTSAVVYRYATGMGLGETYVPEAMAGTVTESLTVADLYAVTGLTPSTDYYILVTFDTGLELMLDVTTPASSVELALELDSSDEEIVSHNAFSFTIDEGMDTQSFTVEVYLDNDDAADLPVPGTNITDNGDGTYDVASLSAETDYYVLVTFADGTFQYLMVTTEAAPAS